MKKLFAMLVLCFMASAMMAQAPADKIVGTYKSVQNGVNNKIKIFKNDKGGYTAQVIWVDNLVKKDGSILTDEKNPDKAKRSVRADQIVLIENVNYVEKDNEWNGGKIYDPTRGKTFKVNCYFKDAKTLTVKGSLGPFFERVYWTKIQ